MATPRASRTSSLCEKFSNSASWHGPTSNTSANVGAGVSAMCAMPQPHSVASSVETDTTILSVACFSGN